MRRQVGLVLAQVSPGASVHHHRANHVNHPLPSVHQSAKMISRKHCTVGGRQVWALNYLVLQTSELLQNAANPHEVRTTQTDLEGLLTFVGPDQMLDRERLALGWALAGIHVLCPRLDLLQDNAGDLLASPKLTRPCSLMHRGCQRG